MKRFHPALLAFAACTICLFAISNFTIAPSQAEAAIAQSKKGTQTQKTMDAEQELIRLEDEANELFLKRQFPKLAKGWADDEEFVNLEGKIVEGKAAALKGMQESKERYDSLNNSDYKIRIHGDVAVVSFLTTATGAISGQGRYTDIVVKRNGKWKLLHSQGTIVQGSLSIPPKK